MRERERWRLERHPRGWSRERGSCQTLNSFGVISEPTRSQTTDCLQDPPTRTPVSPDLDQLSDS